MPGSWEPAQVRFQAAPQVERYVQDQPVRAAGGERREPARSPSRAESPEARRGKGGEKKGKDKGKSGGKGKPQKGSKGKPKGKKGK